MLATTDTAPPAAVPPTISSLVLDFLREEHKRGLLEKTIYTSNTVTEALEILGLVEGRGNIKPGVSSALARFAEEAGEVLGYTTPSPDLGGTLYQYRFRPEVCELRTLPTRQEHKPRPLLDRKVTRQKRTSTRLDGPQTPAKAVPAAEPASAPKAPVAVSWAVETQKVVSTRKTLRIDREALLRLLEAAGLIDEEDTAQGRMSIYVRVPGGADWSNTNLAIEEAPVVVEIERTYVEEG